MAYFIQLHYGPDHITVAFTMLYSFLNSDQPRGHRIPISNLQIWLKVTAFPADTLQVAHSSLTSHM